MRTARAAALIAVASIGAFHAQTPAPPGTPTGDSVRGKRLYEQTFRCYGCHGYDAQSGSPRLVPMTRTQAAFITFVRKPSSPAMPSFADAPMQDLADVYAYIRSLPATAPSVDSLPILRDILQRRTSRP
ncbi:MAG: cytochrome c [Acidobacteria bacterium]|nr:cytochrome c [Acidobacteriota bacterium]